MYDLFRRASRRLSASLIVGAAAASSGGCTVVADVSEDQCKTDTDCAQLNTQSAFELPTCNQGVCELQVCATPKAPSPAVTVTATGLITISPPPGQAPMLSQSLLQPAVSPSISLHACARDDFDCMRTTCNWQSPGVSATSVDMSQKSPTYGQAIFHIPVAPPVSPQAPPFNGYLAVVPDLSTNDYLPIALFTPPPPLSGYAPGGFILPRRDSYDQFALSVQTKIDPTKGTLGILVTEPIMGPPGAAIAIGAAVSLETYDGRDALAVNPDARRLYLDGTGLNVPAATGVQGYFVVFLNVPVGAYLVTATKKESGLTFSAKASILAMAGVSGDMNMLIAPPAPP